MHRLHYVQTLPISLEESWSFFSSPFNLKMLTPDYLDFVITNEEDLGPIYPGQIITYLIRPLFGISIPWTTEITHAEKLYYFIDEQRFGPYRFWHHEHRFRAVEKGVEITDIVYYSLPLGPLGKALNTFKVQRDLENIFTYRRRKLEELFGSL